MPFFIREKKRGEQKAKSIPGPHHPTLVSLGCKSLIGLGSFRFVSLFHSFFSRARGQKEPTTWVREGTGYHCRRRGKRVGKHEGSRRESHTCIHPPGNLQRGCVCVCVSMWALGRHTSVTLLIVCWSRTHAKYRWALPVAGRRVSNLSGRKKKKSLASLLSFLPGLSACRVELAILPCDDCGDDLYHTLADCDERRTGHRARGKARGNAGVEKEKRAAEDGTSVLPGGGRRPCLAGSGGSVRGDSMLSVSFPGCGRFEDMEMR